jgi:hypothetical protein
MTDGITDTEVKRRAGLLGSLDSVERSLNDILYSLEERMWKLIKRLDVYVYTYTEDQLADAEAVGELAAKIRQCREFRSNIVAQERYRITKQQRDEGE